MRFVLLDGFSKSDMPSGWSASAVVLGASIPCALWAGPALALDEIQVYYAEIAEVGQWTYRQLCLPETQNACRQHANRLIVSPMGDLG